MRPTLILSPRFTEDDQALWRGAIHLGWGVERLPTWRVPPDMLTIPNPVLYVEAMFAPSIAKSFGLRLLEPPDDWLPCLPEEYRKRQISLISLGQARMLEGIAFVKPPNDKSFPAKVYRGSELPHEYGDDTPVLVAEVVQWEVEFRCFVLDREPRTTSVYCRHGIPQRETGFAASANEVAEAEAMVKHVCSDSRVVLPKATVLDVGVIAGRGWAVVEQNAAWGAGIYGCEPIAVLNVIQHAALAVDPKRK